MKCSLVLLREIRHKCFIPIPVASVNMAILRAVGLLCIVLFQLSSCRSGPKRAKREFDVDDMPDRMIDNFERILEELALVDKHVHDVNDSLIEYIQGHVEKKLNKLDHLEDLMKHVLNKQRKFCIASRGWVSLSSGTVF